MTDKEKPTSEQLQERQVKALENIAESLDLLLEWVEEIDKEGWGERIQWYLHLFKQKFIDENYEPEEGDAKRKRR